MKRRTIGIIVASAIAVCLLALGVGALTWASGLERMAMGAKDSAEAGARSLAAQDATAAIAQFRSAAESFESADAMLGPEWLGGIAGALPWAGRQYSVAKSLVAIGRDASRAGAELAAVLQEASSTPTPEGSTRLGALLSVGRVRIDTALSLLADAADRAAGLSEEGLDPRLARAVRSLKDALGDVAPFLDRSRALLALERYLLAAPRRILVVSQNSAELRPTGGFVGSYGILNVGPQGFTLEKYTDVYTLPDPRGRVTPPPGARMTKDFSFRDANWWIDFPTSAEAMLGFWEVYGQAPVDGIIALDVVAVKDLLEVFGPVRVPHFKETFTAGNLLDRLMFLIEVKGGGSPNKKDVLVALANELESRVLDADPGVLAQSGLALAHSADQKHVQFYFADPAAQAAVTGIGWSGSIDAPSGTTDLLAVCNAMTLPGKINIAMEKVISYEVALDADGSATTTLVLDYANTAPYKLPPPMSSTFRNYLRVHRAPGTVLGPGVGSAAVEATVTVDIGLPTIVRAFRVPRKTIWSETIVTRVPQAWRIGPAPAVPRSPTRQGSAGGLAPSTSDRVSHYRLFIVRQADLQDVPTSVTVTAPDGWRISSVSAWMTASGEQLTASMDEGSARLSAPLSGDIVLDVAMERR